jgi:cysteine desulfurase
MPSVAPAAVRQAARLCSHNLSSSTLLIRCLPDLRTSALISGTRLRIGLRSYVSESKKDNAQVNVETAIKGDQRDFVSETGRRPGDLEITSVTGMSADAMNPAAGT